MNYIPANEVPELCPEAFAAMPEPYQNDSCLLFFWDEGYLSAQPKPDQVYILGDWVAFYDPELKCWCNTNTNEPIN